MVEFALVLPLLLLIIFGIIDFGKAFNYWVDETHIANQAARIVEVNGTTGGGSFSSYLYSLDGMPSEHEERRHRLGINPPYGVRELSERHLERRRPSAGHG